MKKITRIIILFAVLFCAATRVFSQNANTFYVCSNTAFTLVPQVTSFANFEWEEIGGSSNPIAITQNLSLTAPTLPATTFSTKQYTLRVKDVAGCWSDPDTFTLHILPPISVSIAGASGTFCSGISTSLTLQANVGSLTLPSGVAADQFAWTSGGAPVGTNNFQLAVNTATTPGTTTVAVAVTYSLPAINGGSKLGSCSGNANTVLTVNTAPSTPAITIQ